MCSRLGSQLRESNILRREPHTERTGDPKMWTPRIQARSCVVLVENNVPLPVILRWMGHGSDQVVARYTHARPQFHANTIATLPSIANMQTSAA
jgi:hypothetical protein